MQLSIAKAGDAKRRNDLKFAWPCCASRRRRDSMCGLRARRRVIDVRCHPRRVRPSGVSKFDPMVNFVICIPSRQIDAE